MISSARVLDGDRNMTQSIGLLSYTFLRKTGREDIVVPMVSPIYACDKCLNRSIREAFCRNFLTFAL